MGTLIWLVLLIGASLTLAYRRTDLRTSTIVLGALLVAYLLFGDGGFLWNMLLLALFVLLALLNVESIRRDNVTRRLFGIYRRMLPSMSKTEQEALEAGNVWWDGELFTGMPDWRRLKNLPPPKLTAEEQAFLDGPTEELCRLLDDWQITHELADMPPNVWQFIKENKFFAMIIPKEYGGLQFSPLASSMVLAKLSSRSAVASSTIGVPNSLGPAELLAALRHRRAEAALAAAARERRRGAVLRADVAARRLRRDGARRQRRRLQGHLGRPRDRRHSAQLGQALHHAGADRDRARPRVQALRSRASDRRRRRATASRPR